MSFYSRHILPQLIHWACKQKNASEQRVKIVPEAKGEVLEIGIGSGLNLPFYNPNQIKSLIGIDPSREVWEKRENKADNLTFDFKFLQESADELPFEGNSFDTIVVTFSMCSISEIQEALSEMKRVLRNDGRLLFTEHGKAPEKLVASFQNTINPIWRPFAGGCNLNRDIPGIIKDAGFKINHIEEGYISRLKFASYNYLGIAQK